MDRIRRARPEETAAIRRLIVESMGYWDRSPAYLAGAEELMSLSADDIKRDEAFVLLTGGKFAAFYRVSVNGEEAEIEEMHIRPAWIGQGHGRTLFEHAVQRATARGAHVLHWSTDENAIGFYRRMGGAVVGTERSGIEGDEPLTLMELRLEGAHRHR